MASEPRERMNADCININEKVSTLKNTSGLLVATRDFLGGGAQGPEEKIKMVFQGQRIHCWKRAFQDCRVSGR